MQNPINNIPQGMKSVTVLNSFWPTIYDLSLKMYRKYEYGLFTNVSI